MITLPNSFSMIKIFLEILRDLVLVRTFLRINIEFFLQIQTQKHIFSQYKIGKMSAERLKVHQKYSLAPDTSQNKPNLELSNFITFIL